MRLPRVRFNVRWMMLAVAVAAAALGGTGAALRMGRAAAGYRSKAAKYEAAERALHTWCDTYDSEAAGYRDELRGHGLDPVGDELRYLSELAGLSQRERRRAGLYAALARKYRLAASRPWQGPSAEPADPPRIEQPVWGAAPPAPRGASTRPVRYSGPAGAAPWPGVTPPPEKFPR